MPACIHCTQETNNVFTHPIADEPYYMCNECWRNPEVVEVDDWDTRLPAAFRLERITVYDGESDIHQHQPRRVFNIPANQMEIFTCERCDNDFYGSSTWIQDLDSPWCQHCVNGHAHWDEDSEEYYQDRNNFPDHDRGERPVPPRRQRSAEMVPHIGGPHPMFLTEPMVGIEFEHAPVQEKDTHSDYTSLYDYIITGNYTPEIHWSTLFNIHSDGSIMSMNHHCSSEIITMPASGTILAAIIDRFYEPFAIGKFMPGPENHTCGFHIHVASKLLRFFIEGGTMADKQQRISTKIMLINMATICKEFVSSTRRASQYCSTEPRLRDKGLGAPGTDAMAHVFGTGGYPSIAVRTFGTLEYRIWPSSNSIKNTKARAELSQKLTAFWDDALIAPGGAVGVNREKQMELQRIALMCVGGERLKVPAELQTLLHLSDEATSVLTKLSQRFNPFSGKQTHFRFTDYQVRCIKDEHSAAGMDFIIPDGETVNHIGDTTANSSGTSTSTGEYLTFGEAIKCYPANQTGKMPELIVALAKGEI